MEDVLKTVLIPMDHFLALAIVDTHLPVMKELVLNVSIATGILQSKLFHSGLY